MIENNLKGMWNRCLQVIKDNVPEKTYTCWFEPIEPIKFENNTLFIGVPTLFFYEMLDGPFLNIMRKALEKGIVRPFNSSGKRKESRGREQYAAF